MNGIQYIFRARAAPGPGKPAIGGFDHIPVSAGEPKVRVEKAGMVEVCRQVAGGAAVGPRQACVRRFVNICFLASPVA